jgi:PPOX class probable F420-dependent enzyme
MPLPAENERALNDILGQVPASHRDLLLSPLTAVLTTVDATGRPQSTAVWYLVDGDGRLKGSITSDRQKYKNLSANPDCCLFIIDPDDPFRTLEIRAEAELEADPDKATVRKFAEAYQVDEALLASATEDRYTVTYRPRRVVANPSSGRS